MDRTSASPPVQPIQNVPESELRNRFARPDHHVDVPGAAEARAGEGKAQEQLAEAKILSHSEQVVAEGCGLKDGTPKFVRPEGVSESRAVELEKNYYLEQRRLQGQASQPALPVLPPDHVDIPGDDLALASPHIGFLVGGVLASLFGSTTGLLAIGMAFGGATDAALTLGAVSLPLLTIAFYCWRNFG
ncbi:MAG TPA: hypothetical protein VMU56_08655 [Beijerinckiaceae bacterium]|nr:hypothetical protein [Beijerinckiaceae bacterium]